MFETKLFAKIISMYPVVPVVPVTVNVISLEVELKFSPETVELDETENICFSMFVMTKPIDFSVPIIKDVASPA